MSFLGMAAGVAAFATIAQTDAVTQESISAHAAMDSDGNALALMCQPGSGNLVIQFLPAGYRGPLTPLGRALSKVQSRFDGDPVPQAEYWDVDDHALTYGRMMLGAVSAKARFIDSLARNSAFHIRYNVAYDAQRSITLHYAIDPDQLAAFIGACNPKGVIRELRKIGSPAAPK